MMELKSKKEKKLLSIFYLEGFSNSIVLIVQCRTSVLFRSDNASSISSLGSGCPNLKLQSK